MSKISHEGISVLPKAEGEEIHIKKNLVDNLKLTSASRDPGQRKSP